VRLATFSLTSFSHGTKRYPSTLILSSFTFLLYCIIFVIYLPEKFNVLCYDNQADLASFCCSACWNFTYLHRVFVHCCYYVNIMKVSYYSVELFKRWSGCRFWAQYQNFDHSWCGSELVSLTLKRFINFAKLGRPIDDINIHFCLNTWFWTVHSIIFHVCC
jgi:hypothetical protein